MMWKLGKPPQQLTIEPKRIQPAVPAVARSRSNMGNSLKSSTKTELSPGKSSDFQAMERHQRYPVKFPGMAIFEDVHMV
jgi:hypothetical protein